VSDSTELLTLSKSLGDKAKSLSAVAKDIAKMPDDPFFARKKLRSSEEKLRKLSFDVPSELAKRIEALDAECTIREAEFWNDVSALCERHNWTLDGSTSRRLIQRGIFIELKRSRVVIDELLIETSPYVPALESQLEDAVAALQPSNARLPRFLDLVAEAYDFLGGNSGRSIEDVFKIFVMRSQKQTFWKCPSGAAFSNSTRPSFRAQLSFALESGATCSDGREISFGTVISSESAWEMYSPGEGRVVQIGRISFSERKK
jgi:hypothetical protein